MGILLPLRVEPPIAPPKIPSPVNLWWFSLVRFGLIVVTALAANIFYYSWSDSFDCLY